LTNKGFFLNAPIDGVEPELGECRPPLHGRPWFAKLSFHDGLKEEIAAVHSDFQRGLHHCPWWNLLVDASIVKARSLSLRGNRALPTTV